MQELSRRTGFSGPKLVRLLARLNDADVSESRQSLSDRLSLWLGWTDAIALSAALSSAPQGVFDGALAPGSAEERECARVRTALENAITGKHAQADDRPRRGSARVSAAVEPETTAVTTYAADRQRYSSLQQTMEKNIASLRRRLRARLAATTPDMSRLAAMDAVMEQALGARERSLLAGVPGLLEAHFDRLRHAAQTTSAEGPDAEPAPAPPGAWREVFRKDMESVLLAELEIRLQPIEGLLAALRAC